MHSLSVSGEVNGARGVSGLLAAKLFQCRLGKQTASSSSRVCQSRCKVAGGDSRALAGTGARLVSAVRGCFFSWGQCSLPAGTRAAPPSAVGPALLTPGRSLFRVVRTCGLGGK